MAEIKVLSAQALSEMIISKSDLIVTNWLEEVKAYIPAAHHASEKVIIDSLPKYLVEISEILIRPEYTNTFAESLKTSSAHGLTRSKLAYSVRDMATEYTILREVILSLIPAGSELSKEAAQLLNRIIDSGMINATEEFLSRTLVDQERLARKDAAYARNELESFFMQAPEPMVMFSGPEHLFTLANVPYIDFIGKDPVGRTVREVFTDQEAGNFFALLDQVYNTGMPYEGKELPFLRIDEKGIAQERWINIGYYPSRNPTGKIVGIHAFVHDVTDQVRLRKEIEASQVEIAEERSKLREIFQVSPAAMAIWSGEDLVFEKVNPKYQEIFPGRQLLGRKLLDACPELAGQGFAEKLIEVLRTGVPYIGKSVPATIRLPDGSLVEHYYDFSYIQLKDAEGKPIGVYDHAVDVTETATAREALLKSEARVRRYAEAMPQMAFIANSAGEITYFNRRFYDYIGIPKGEVEGRNWENKPIHHPEDLRRTIERWNRSITTGEPYEIEYRLRRHDGEYRWHLGRAVAEKDDQGNIVEWFGTNTDIHDQKILTEQLHEAIANAEAANSAKSAFLANMSHEIRTPLGAIMGFSDLARQADASKSDVNSYLTIIDRNSKQVLRIVDDILDLAKVEAGKVQLEHIEIRLAEFLADFSSLMGFRARENGIVFELEAKSSLPDRIIGDPTRIRQILTNSVGNAIKFTSRGSVRLEVSCIENCLHFDVKDTGRGITPEQVEKLFQAFVQADASTTRKFGGTGLGLVITKRLSQLMGGDYKLVKSELGVGSEFLATIHVELPADAQLISTGDLAFSTVEAAEIKPPKKRLEGVRILLVEDSPDNQMLVRLMLEKQGADLEIASDGLEGMRRALSDEFHLVLMDIQMPKMDGHEAIRKLRAQGFSVPTFALTAHAMKEEMDRAHQSGFTGFISKPIEREILIETIARTLNLQKTN